MRGHAATRSTALALDFLTAARRYWLHAFPHVRLEAHRWRRRAQAIADPALRRFALEAQHTKRGNVEGSAAFAVLAPAGHRAAVVRAQVAFQSIYDYVDTLSEQPTANPVLNGRQLHQALLVALDPSAVHPDYYALYPHSSDNGYLKDMVDACREALATLPSIAAIAVPARRITERIVAYQSLNLTEPQGGHGGLERWALKQTPPDTDLRWWETAASAGSSLGFFALAAVAAQTSLAPDKAIAIEAAYWPWAGALHSLLDSLIDEPEDAAAAQHSLLAYYSGPEETAVRLRLLATETLRALQRLPQGRQHRLIVTGMAGYYLTAHEALTSTGAQASREIVDMLGAIAKPTMLLLGARRAVGRISQPISRTWRELG
jgi:tetraprenyl-beta-curcumene synthase